MKLSQLIDYLNLLDNNELLPVYERMVEKLQDVQYTVENHHAKIPALADDFQNHLNILQNTFEAAMSTVEELKNQTRQHIASLETEQYQSSQQLYEQEMCYETNEYILNRRLSIDPNTKLALVARLRQYTDWRLPGMIIRPGLENFIEHLVPLDPLYVVDHNLDLLQPAVSAFTPEYQRRLRCYAINDYEHIDPLWQLPYQQFGLIFAYNYFNYKPIKVLNQYLESMFYKLRPGGVAIFTFNDCDWAHGAALAEQSFMCYTPRRQIIAQCSKVGFEILDYQRGQGDSAWMEIRRPGEIESIRGGQTLAKIIAIQ